MFLSFYLTQLPAEIRFSLLSFNNIIFNLKIDGAIGVKAICRTIWPSRKKNHLGTTYKIGRLGRTRPNVEGMSLDCLVLSFHFMFIPPFMKLNFKTEAKQLTNQDPRATAAFASGLRCRMENQDFSILSLCCRPKWK